MLAIGIDKAPSQGQTHPPVSVLQWPPRLYDIKTFVETVPRFANLAVTVARNDWLASAIELKICKLYSLLEMNCDPTDSITDILAEDNDVDRFALIVGRTLAMYSKDSKKFDFLLCTMVRLHPEKFNSLFLINENRQITFSVEGCELLLEIMKAIKSLSVPCEICYHQEELLLKVSTFIQGDEEKAAWIMRFADSEDRREKGIHYCPIYAEKIEGGVSFAITDSLGDNGFGQELVELLRGILGDQTAFYYLTKEKRKYLPGNSFIFALKDIIQMVKFPKAMQFLREHSRCVDEESQVFAIGMLPHHMMKYAQDIDQILQYERRVQNGILTRSLSKKRCLRRISLNGQSIRANLIINDLTRKYCAMIVAVSLAYGDRIRQLPIAIDR